MQVPNLSTLTKNSPLRATGAHVSVIAHVTQPELLAQLTEVERANGFANRFLFMLVRRSKELPDGGSVPADRLMPLIAKLREVIKVVRHGLIERDDEAKAIWREVLSAIFSEGQPGLLGAVISRAEAQVLRLSVLYAILDKSRLICPDHLQAAWLAVWRYCEESATSILRRPTVWAWSSRTPSSRGWPGRPR